MEKTVKVYSAQWCGNCKGTKMQLDKEQVKYETVDIDELDDDTLTTLDIKAIPVVVIEEDGKEIARFVNINKAKIAEIKQLAQ